MTLPQPPRRPISTYRLQFHGDFRFPDAQEVVPYLAELGVTECDSSPLLRANPGSRHGYDICEHGRLNPELGSRADFDRFCDALQAWALGHIVDVVPNHMACDPRSNPWWRDVLENGPSSPFSSYFDIDWDPIKPELKGKVLLPVLGDQYGCVLERGELQLRFADGALHLRYFDLELPVNPRRTPLVLGLHVDALERELAGDAGLREYLSILTALQNLPANTERDAARIAERQREKEVARERLARLVDATPTIRAHVEACIRLANGAPGDAASFDSLHGLLELQAYRLAYWRTASDEINHRRFFDINELVGLRMEEPAVFEAAHGLIQRLVGEGKITGLRVDHPDGLFDPATYFDRLQEMTKEAGAPAGAASPEGRSFYVVAEKILSSGESLNADWQVHGTTGYGFLNAGMINSLSQLVLKLASPGVPDCYQGTELWDLSLVDPDNRRPVDFGYRRRLLETLRPLADRIGAGRAAEQEVADLLERWEDGRIKMFVLTCGLRFRRDHPALMAAGAYRPLECDGPAADRLVAFARADDSGTLLVIVPRLVAPLVTADRPLPLGDAWAHTRIALPGEIAGRRYAHVLTGETVEAGSSLAAAAVFRTSPVALLWARAD